MKITEVSSDGLGVSALIAAAGAVNDLLVDRNVGAAVVKGGPDSVEVDTLVVFAKRDEGTGLPLLAVTVETNPRLLHLAPEPTRHDGPDDEPPARTPYLGADAVGGGPHYHSHSDGGQSCRCFGPCCHDGDADLCVCRGCTSTIHDHGR